MLPSQESSENDGFHKKVFVNCPYDSNYLPFFHIIIFTIHDCGFEAKYGLQYNGSSQDRLTKILDLVNNSRLSIHDVSIAENKILEDGRVRLNMAFECGLAFGVSFLKSQDSTVPLYNKMECRRDILVLGKERGFELSTISDISGRDPSFHQNNTSTLILEIRKFLSDKNLSKNGMLRSHTLIETRYKKFNDDLKSKFDTNSENYIGKNKNSRRNNVSYKQLVTLDYINDWSKIAATWIAKNIK